MAIILLRPMTAPDKIYVIDGHRRIALCLYLHDDVIKWKHFPRYWPFASGIHRSTVDSPHKGQ